MSQATQWNFQNHLNLITLIQNWISWQSITYFSDKSWPINIALPISPKKNANNLAVYSLCVGGTITCRSITIRPPSERLTSKFGKDLVAGPCNTRLLRSNSLPWHGQTNFSSPSPIVLPYLLDRSKTGVGKWFNREGRFAQIVVILVIFGITLLTILGAKK